MIDRKNIPDEFYVFLYRFKKIAKIKKERIIYDDKFTFEIIIDGRKGGIEWSQAFHNFENCLEFSIDYLKQKILNLEEDLKNIGKGYLNYE